MNMELDINKDSIIQKQQRIISDLTHRVLLLETAIEQYLAQAQEAAAAAEVAAEDQAQAAEADAAAVEDKASQNGNPT
jgi:septum formation inhibitor MinC